MQKGFQCHSNRSRNSLNLKKKQQNQVTLFKFFFVIFLIVVVTHNTFTTEHTYARFIRGKSSEQ